jgi:hypothetical protein
MEPPYLEWEAIKFNTEVGWLTRFVTKDKTIGSADLHQR